ncbi:hypothetical protein BY458DRAFT_524060 [Sporodiniella umbellata]|nr:hypothetical protein BY458DRAFT_524060 [Sporodiniella umbellata]
MYSADIGSLELLDFSTETNDLSYSTETSKFLSSKYNAASEQNTSQNEMDPVVFSKLSLESSMAEMHRSLQGQSNRNFEGSRTIEVENASEDESQLPSATADAMETYINIAENIYCGSATGKSIAEESMPCECKYLPEVDDPDAACGDDNNCINRMMFMECTVEDCSCGRYCRNRRFQLRQYARVDVIRTEKKGFGLRALTDLPSNAFIMEYIGEVIPNQEFIRRTKEYETSGLEHYYFMTLKTDEIIDATKKGYLARFINHSCNPNCVTQKWVVGKHMRIGIFTNRFVKAGEELTFDYKFERYGAQAQVCYCGESVCKGFIGGSSKSNNSSREKLTSNNRSSPNEDDDDDDDDDRKQSGSDIEEAVTLTQKRMLRKMNRRKDSLPLQHPDEVKSFVKRMLDSVGKSHLVMRLLHRLELTDKDSSLGKEIFRRFIRLHGLKMLKFWLGEWKNDSEILARVLHVLVQLPLSNRNGLEDCKMFEVVGKFGDDEDENISGLAQQILSNWEQLKSVYRIPKRNVAEQPQVYENQPAVNDAVEEQDNYIEPHRSAQLDSSREFFDPDDDYFEYLSMDVDTSEIQWKIEYPPRSVVPTAPRAMIDACIRNGFYGYGRSPRSYLFNSRHSSIALEMDQAALQNVGSYSSHNRVKSNESLVQSNDNHSIDSSSIVSASSLLKKLPINWKFAHAENGAIYYYHRITGKTQWNFPEEKPSTIDGTHQADLECSVEKTTEKKKIDYIKNESTMMPSVSDTDTRGSQMPMSLSRRGSIDTSNTLSENDLKKAIGKIVIKHLSSKPKELWNDDKHMFKELARKITHHIVDREIKSSRKLQSMNNSIRTKIEKFIDAHGADLVSKLGRKRKRQAVTTSKEVKQMLVDSPRSITSEDTNKYSKEAFSPSASSNNTAISESGNGWRSERTDLPSPSKKRMTEEIGAFANLLTSSNASLSNLENIIKTDKILLGSNNTISNNMQSLEKTPQESNGPDMFRHPQYNLQHHPIIEITATTQGGNLHPIFIETQQVHPEEDRYQTMTLIDVDETEKQLFKTAAFKT